MQYERRITHRLVDYWQQIKGNKLLPSERDIDAEDIADMWRDCFILSVASDTLTGEKSCSYTYVGEGVMALYTAEEGSSGTLLTLPYEKLAAIYDEMCLTKLPVVEQVENFMGGYWHFHYRQCLLPLGTEEGVVDGMLGGMRYKEC